MATTAMVAAYLRQLLVEEHGEEVVRGDGSFELPLAGGVRIWVMDGRRHTRRVLITARLLDDVEPMPELLTELNRLNAGAPYGRFFAVDGAVHVEETLLAEALDPETLFAAIGFVAWAAEVHGEELRERLGVALGAGVPSTGDAVAGAAAVDLGTRSAPLVDDVPVRGIAAGDRSAVSAGGYL